MTVPWTPDEEYSRLSVDNLAAIAPVSPAEEKRLIRLMTEGKKASKRLQNHTQIEEERHRLLETQVQEGATARRQLIQANGRLVIHIAAKYYNNGRSGLTLAELCQEGVLGLIRAIDKFDHGKKVRLSTYATWWIRQSVGRAIAVQTRSIRLPVHRVEKLQQVFRVRGQLTAQYGREPTVEEIAVAVGLSVEKVEQAFRDSSSAPISLDEPLEEGEEATLYNFVEDDSLAPTYQSVDHQLCRQDIYRAFGILTPREVRVLELRFGLRDGNALTLQAVADRFGLTRERVRQIEKEALQKLGSNPIIGRRLIEHLY